MSEKFEFDISYYRCKNEPIFSLSLFDGGLQPAFPCQYILFEILGEGPTNGEILRKKVSIPLFQVKGIFNILSRIEEYPTKDFISFLYAGPSNAAEGFLVPLKDIESLKSNSQQFELSRAQQNSVWQ